MSSSNPSTFKINFEKTGQKRRFPATSTFAELSKSLILFWGDHPYILTYLDEDNDLITVSSEIEFTEALSVANNMNSKVLKFDAYANVDELKLKLNQEKETPMSTNVERAVHIGIECDRSGMNPIIGTRYHVPGADYDLCEEEFEKLPETERVVFVKIETPRGMATPCVPGFSHPSMNFNRMFGSCPRMNGNRCPRRPGCGSQFMAQNGSLPPCVSAEDVALQASIAASLFDNLQSLQNDNSPPPFAQVLSSFIDAAGVAAVAAASKDKPSSSNGVNPLGDLLAAVRDFAPQNTNGDCGGCSSDDNKSSEHSERKQRMQEHCKKMREQFKQMQEQSADGENNPLKGHPLSALFSGLFDPSHNPCTQNNKATSSCNPWAKNGGGGGASSLSSSSEKAIHFGIICDKSGMNPIVGIRYVIPEANYDLCEEEFEKLPESERVLYSMITAPGQEPIPCMQVKPSSSSKTNGKGAAAAEEEDDDLYSDESDSDEVESTVKPIETKGLETTMKETKKVVASNEKKKDEIQAPVVTEKKKEQHEQGPSSEEPKVESEDAIFATQLVELASMGFVDRDVNLTLLKRYQGRVDRVINYLLEL